MSDLLATVDRLMAVLDRQSDINESNLRALDGLNQLDDRRAAEITELREGLATLSKAFSDHLRLDLHPGPVGESVRVLRQP